MMTQVNEQKTVGDEHTTNRDRVFDVVTHGAAGGAIAVLFILVMVSATGNSTPDVIAELFLVGSAILAVGFVAFGGRALSSGRTSEACIAFASIVVWIAFAIVQIVTLAT
jgi:hypothetical protein